MPLSTTIKNWLIAARPRTLTLSLAACLIGNACTWHHPQFDWLIALLAIILAIALQVLSNLANDLGDSARGTDDATKRIGPKRTVQSGLIKPRHMQIAIGMMVAIVVICGSILTFLSFKEINFNFILFIFLGLLAIIAAIKYTLGKYPYGYYGFGDFFAFLFFGPVAVIGICVLQTNGFSVTPVLPAIGMGLISTAVLNINNMRDHDNDKAVGKKTIAVKLGFGYARIYQVILIVLSQAAFLSYSLLFNNSPRILSSNFLYVLVFIPQYLILMGIFKAQHKKSLDKFLTATAISAFATSLVLVATSLL